MPASHAVAAVAIANEAAAADETNIYLQQVAKACTAALNHAKRLESLARRQQAADNSQAQAVAASAKRAATHHSAPVFTADMMDIYGDGLSPCMGKILRGGR